MFLRYFVNGRFVFLCDDSFFFKIERVKVECVIFFVHLQPTSERSK